MTDVDDPDKTPVHSPDARRRRSSGTMLAVHRIDLTQLGAYRVEFPDGSVVEYGSAAAIVVKTERPVMVRRRT